MDIVAPLIPNVPYEVIVIQIRESDTDTVTSYESFN